MTKAVQLVVRFSGSELSYTWFLRVPNYSRQSVARFPNAYKQQRCSVQRHSSERVYLRLPTLLQRVLLQGPPYAFTLCYEAIQGFSSTVEFGSKRSMLALVDVRH